MLDSEVIIPAEEHFSVVETAKYRELLSALCSQLVLLGDPNVAQVTAKWLREANELDDSPGSRRRLVAQAGRIKKTAYALTILAREKTPAKFTKMQADELTTSLNDLLTEASRIEKESRQIDTILEDRGLEMIIGEKLISVGFVLDYLHFDFGGPALSAYSVPTFRSRGSVLRETDAGYRDALCGLIGKTVERVQVRESEGLEIAFEGAGAIEISLRPEDRKSQEAAEFWSPTGRFGFW